MEYFTWVLRNWGLRVSFGVKISHQRGGEPCPQWTPRQIGYGRSFSCSFWWQRYPHTVQRPPRWAAQWRFRANHPQIPSYTLEGVPSWLEAEGLSNMEKERNERKFISIEGTTVIPTVHGVNSTPGNPPKTLRLQFTDYRVQLVDWHSCSSVHQNISGL